MMNMQTMASHGARHKQLPQQWDFMFGLLRAHLAAADGRLPDNGSPLSKWLVNNRHRIGLDLHPNKPPHIRAIAQHRRDCLHSIGIPLSRRYLPWQTQFHMLKDHLSSHGTIPRHGKSATPSANVKSTTALARFLNNTRMDLIAFARDRQRHPEDFQRKCRRRIEQLRSIGIDVLSTTTEWLSTWKSHAGCWEPVIVRNKETEEDDTDAMHMLLSQLDVFASTPAWQHVKLRFRSITEYVLWCLNVGDIPPEECTRECPVYTMRYLLSYVVHPEPMAFFVDPTSTHPSGESSFFCSNLILTDQISPLLDKLMEAELPPWLTQMFTKHVPGEQMYAVDDLVTKIAGDPNWFDHFPVSLLGHNPAGGALPITQTTQPGPRRLALSAEIHGPFWSNYHNCSLEELYGYAYSFLPRAWMGCRSLRKYETIAKLGEHIWRLVRGKLDPVSQAFPPNSANLLFYFGAFHSRIQPHQDNAPNMGIDPQHNSQLLGSSVMVLNLCHEQVLEFTSLDGGDTVGSFVCPHGSVYILGANDDLMNKHQAKFTGKHVGKVRIAVVFRWLGRRTKVFCSDYGRRRQHVEVFYNIHKELLLKWPKCATSRANYELPRSKDKSLHPAQSVDVRAEVKDC
jgi:hypothetical protein